MTSNTTGRRRRRPWTTAGSSRRQRASASTRRRSPPSTPSCSGPSASWARWLWIDNPSDPIRHILDKPLFADPGSKYDYRDADPQLVTYAVERQAGRPESAIAADFLFTPLGIHDYYWDHGEHGETMGAHGLHLRPRDLAKVGQLMADGGAWNGTPIISADWYASSTTAKVAPDGHPRLGYGYYWWTVPEAGGFSTWGHGGQFAFVVPAQRLVMVLVSMPDTNGDVLHGGELEQFVDLTKPLWAAAPSP